MPSFQLSFYIFTTLLSISTFISAIFVMYFRLYTLKILPKALRLYLIISFFPFILILSLSTTILGFRYIFAPTQPILPNDFINYFVAFSLQTIRNVFYTLILERILATIYWETYTKSHKFSLFWYMLIFSLIATSIYMVVLDKYGPSTNFVIYYVFAIHCLNLLICILLFYLNKQMYRLTAYRISLRKRHQILENVKVLSFLFPSILIHTLISPLGSIITMIMNVYKLPLSSLPPSFAHVFYNLPLLLICIRHIMLTKKLSWNSIGAVTEVRDAMGNSLPTAQTTEKYFKDLQLQWNN